MERIIARMKVSAPDATDIERWLVEDFPASADYKQQRSEYIREGKGKPPAEQT